MATLSEPRPAHEAPGLAPPGDGRASVLLSGVRWETYEALLRDLHEGGSNVRLTYDRGWLELMSPGHRHERNKGRLGRLVEALTEELDIAIASGGSTTFRSRLLERGLEPDECYWIQNEARVRDLEDLDPESDPPPDLAIEVESTRSAIEKAPLYAALGFPELWFSDGESIRVGRLQADGSYAWGGESACLPFLGPAELAPFLAPARGQGETAWIRAFRAWVRAELAPRLGRPGG